MAAAAVPYDKMAEGDTEEADEPTSDADDADPADDDEFMMHAEDAGFSGDKAKALWRAVARCVELIGQGPMPMADEEDMG
jgi:hypothetical protein